MMMKARSERSTQKQSGNGRCHSFWPVQRLGNRDKVRWERGKDGCLPQSDLDCCVWFSIISWTSSTVVVTACIGGGVERSSGERL